MRERKWKNEKKKKEKRNHIARPESRVSLIKISNESRRCLHSLKKKKKKSVSNVCKHDREIGEWIEATNLYLSFEKISFLAKQRIAS